MEKQYSVQFFTSFVEHLQDVCRNYLNYNQFVEVSGYVCVEIDNMKKERYVLSELLQSSGNVVSESYCTKAFKTLGQPKATPQVNSPPRSFQQTGRNEWTKENRNTRNQPQRPRPYSSSSCQGVSMSHRPPSTTAYRSTEVAVPRDYPSTPVSLSSRTHTAGSASFPDSLGSKSPRRSYEVRTVTPSTQSSVMDIDQTDLGPRALTIEEVEEVIDLDLLGDEDNIQSELMSSSFGASLTDMGSLSSVSPDLETQKFVSPGSLGVMKSAVKRFKNYHFDKSGLDIDLLSTPPHQLNQLLLEYFKGAKKQDGTLITPGSLRNVQIYLERYLKQQGYPHSITKDVQFKTSRDYLRMRVETEEKGKQHPRPIPIDSDDIELMFERDVLGSHTSETLINTMWFLVSKYFGLRGPMEHINLKWGDITLKETDDGVEYLERVVNGSFSLKEFSKPYEPNRCFVNFYKQYRAMRPKGTLDDTSPFYLKPSKGQGQEQDTMLSAEPLVYSYFSSLWRKMISVAGLPSKKKII